MGSPAGRERDGEAHYVCVAYGGCLAVWLASWLAARLVAGLKLPYEPQVAPEFGQVHMPAAFASFAGAAWLNSSLPICTPTVVELSTIPSHLRINKRSIHPRAAWCIKARHSLSDLALCRLLLPNQRPNLKCKVCCH
jgi:hypothetical protein